MIFGPKKPKPKPPSPPSGPAGPTHPYGSIPVYKSASTCPKAELYLVEYQRLPGSKEKVPVAIHVHPDRWDEFQREVLQALREQKYG